MSYPEGVIQGVKCGLDGGINIGPHSAWRAMNGAILLREPIQEMLASGALVS